MATLFVDRRGLSLKVDGGVLVFYEENQRVATVPLKVLSRVCLMSDVMLSASVLGKLGTLGIGIVVLSGRKREPCLLMPAFKVDALRRCSQVRLAQNEEFCMGLVKSCLAEKLQGQAALLQNLALHEAAAQIHTLRERLNEVLSLDSLRGLEGAAAAAYFSAWATVLPASWQFSGRNRRPPKDGINAFLSLGYTLLHFELVRECYLAGLDPFVGFYHQVAHGRESLASDLLESLRPLYDAWLLQAVKEGVFRPEDCSIHDGACVLGKAARLRFYPAYEAAAKIWRVNMRQSLRQLLRRLAEHSGEDLADFVLEEPIVMSDALLQEGDDALDNCL